MMIFFFRPMGRANTDIPYRYVRITCRAYFSSITECPSENPKNISFHLESCFSLHNECPLLMGISGVLACSSPASGKHFLPLFWVASVEPVSEAGKSKQGAQENERPLKRSV